MSKQSSKPNAALLTRKQVSTEIGLSERHIVRMVERGRFPRPCKIGTRHVRWFRSDLDAWLADMHRQKDAMA